MAPERKPDAEQKREPERKRKDRALKVPRVQQRLDCCRAMVYKLVAAGDLRAIKIRGMMRILESSVDALIERNSKSE